MSQCEDTCEGGGPQVTAALGDVAERGSSGSQDGVSGRAGMPGVMVDGRSLLSSASLTVFYPSPNTARRVSRRWLSYHELAAVFAADQSVSQPPFKWDVSYSVRIKVAPHISH